MKNVTEPYTYSKTERMAWPLAPCLQVTVFLRKEACSVDRCFLLN